MSGLQKVALGTPPTAVDGDTSRGANTKMNANVDVLNTQATLTSTAALITASQALTVAHVGTRVNINIAAAGTINLPAASTCAADQVIHLRNLGTTLITLAITTGSGDTIGLTTLAAGESALFDTDGVHAWRALLRGRSVNANETVSGNLAVSGTLTRAGNVVWDKGNLPGVPVRSSVSTNTISIDWQRNTTGKVSLYVDAVNLGDIVETGSAQTVTGAKTFAAALTASFAPGSSIGQQNFNALGGAGLGNMGFASNNANASVIVRCSTAGVFEVVNGLSNGYSNITCASLTQTSDRDLKTDIVPVRAVLPLLRTKRVVNYKFKSPASSGGGAGDTQIGVIAQEWQADFPELIEETGADIDADGDFIAHQYAPLVEIMKEVAVLDEEGNETGEVRYIGTGEFTGGEEIFGPNGKPESRQALGFKYASSAAVAIAGVIEVDAVVQTLLERIAALEAKVGA